MLRKTISIDAYVREEETEFPEFSCRNCKVLRRFYEQGKEIVQVEPYVEHLMHIHALFAEGKKPTDIMKINTLKNVYNTERKTTAALLHFYEASIRSEFQKVVESVKKFAAVDAERFRLRDTMRAHAIAKILFNAKSVYIEAGGMHIYLEKILKKILDKKYCIKTESLLLPVIKKMTRENDVFAPGDILTMHYILNKKKHDDYETLLAARSIIYIKLLVTEEMLPSRKEKTPHIKDEIMANELIKGLTYEQCEELFTKIRFQKRQKSLETLQRYL
jgi:hypothetical protein